MVASNLSVGDLPGKSSRYGTAVGKLLGGILRTDDQDVLLSGGQGVGCTRGAGGVPAGRGDGRHHAAPGVAVPGRADLPRGTAECGDRAADVRAPAGAAAAAALLGRGAGAAGEGEAAQQQCQHRGAAHHVRRRRASLLTPPVTPSRWITTRHRHRSSQ